jgi:hypothetical protein
MLSQFIINMHSLISSAFLYYSKKFAGLLCRSVFLNLSSFMDPPPINLSGTMTPPPPIISYVDWVEYTVNKI